MGPAHYKRIPRSWGTPLLGGEEVGHSLRGGSEKEGSCTMNSNSPAEVGVDGHAEAQYWVKHFREARVSSFNHWTETYPDQSELHNISSFPSILTNQNCSIMNNQNTWCWPIRTARIWKPHLHKMTPVGNFDEHFLLLSWWIALSVLCFLSLQTVPSFDGLGQGRTGAGKMTAAVSIFCSSDASDLVVAPQRYPYLPQAGFAYLQSQVLWVPESCIQC